MRLNSVLKRKHGFTLTELILTVLVIAVISLLIVIVLNPAELENQSRDAIRVTDTSQINKTINLLYSDNPTANLGALQTIYVSLPDSSPTCANLGLPSLPGGWQYHCVTTSTLKNVNGTGWIPVDLTSYPGGATLSVWPVDPQNTTTSNRYYTYTAVNRDWELTATISSNKYGPVAQNDGGLNPGTYETGTNPKLTPFVGSSLLGYWTFDDGSGAIAADSSGYGNNGSLHGGGTNWVASGKRGGAISFDGVDGSYVGTADIDPWNDFTAMAWFQTTSTSGTIRRLIDKDEHIGGVMGDYFLLYVQDSNIGANLRHTSGTQVSVGSTGKSANDGQWHHAAFVRSGVNLYVYYDGSLAGSNTYPYQFTFDASVPLWIGWSIYNQQNPLVFPNQDFKGKIDDVRIYGRALSQSEVTSIYNGN